MYCNFPRPPLTAEQSPRTNFVDELLLSSRCLFACKLLEETLPHHDGRVCSQEGTNVPCNWFRVTVLPSSLCRSLRRRGERGAGEGRRKERAKARGRPGQTCKQGVSQRNDMSRGGVPCAPAVRSSSPHALSSGLSGSQGAQHFFTRSCSDGAASSTETGNALLDPRDPFLLLAFCFPSEGPARGRRQAQERERERKRERERERTTARRTNDADWAIHKRHGVRAHACASSTSVPLSPPRFRPHQPPSCLSVACEEERSTAAS
jgi:hypothetical protein